MQTSKLKGLKYLNASSFIKLKVDIFISRDLDSKFTERENAAVLEWIASGQYFHTMRDRLQQDYWPIIASTWGTKLSDATFRYNWTVAWKQAMKDDMMHVTQDHYDEDQKFLMRFTAHIILIINLKLP